MIDYNVDVNIVCDECSSSLENGDKVYCKSCFGEIDLDDEPKYNNPGDDKRSLRNIKVAEEKWIQAVRGINLGKYVINTAI